MIDEKTVSYLAEMARIHLTPEEAKHLERDLQKILAYVEDLKQVNTDGLPEVSQVTGITNAVREDLPMPTTPEIHQRLVDSFPQKQGEFLKVKAVFADEDE